MRRKAWQAAGIASVKVLAIKAGEEGQSGENTCGEVGKRNR